jgi:hypothetical protein
LHEYVSKHYPSTVAELRKNPNYWRWLYESYNKCWAD